MGWTSGILEITQISLADALDTRFSDVVWQCLEPEFYFEPRHEKTCFNHMRTTKVQISLHICAV